jgi:site-specific recombinase XerD
MEIKQFMKTIEGLAANTRRAYEETLWLFDSDVNGGEPTGNNMQKFLNRYTPSSLHRHKAALKAYWEWKNPEIPWPFNRRSFLAPRQHKLKYLNPDVVLEMADKAETTDDRMFIRTLFMLGCRIHEIRAVDHDALTEAGVVVKTKGGQTKLKVLTKDFMAELRKYAAHKKGKVFPMSYNYYNQLVHKLGAAAGHPEAAPHMLRHARAVDLLRKGMKLSDLQQFLGHASINTTAIYLQVTGGELSDVLEELENGKYVRTPPEVLPESKDGALPLRLRRKKSKKGPLAAPGGDR